VAAPGPAGRRCSRGRPGPGARTRRLRRGRWPSRPVPVPRPARRL